VFKELDPDLLGDRRLFCETTQGSDDSERTIHVARKRQRKVRREDHQLLHQVAWRVLALRQLSDMANRWKFKFRHLYARSQHVREDQRNVVERKCGDDSQRLFLPGGSSR
jgi:hypothetical protein